MSKLGLPRLTEISVNSGSDSWFGFGSTFPDFGSVQVCTFLTINVVKTDILTGKSYKI